MTTQTLIDAPRAALQGFIFTTRGDMPECLLRKEKITEEYPDATVTANEYYIGAELVRRDVNLALKSKALFDVQAQEF